MCIVANRAKPSLFLYKLSYGPSRLVGGVRNLTLVVTLDKHGTNLGILRPFCECCCDKTRLAAIPADAAVARQHAGGLET